MPTKQAVTVNILDRGKVAHNEHRQTAATVIKDDKTDPRPGEKIRLMGKGIQPVMERTEVSSAQGGREERGRAVGAAAWSTMHNCHGARSHTTQQVGGRENSQAVSAQDGMVAQPLINIMS